MSINLEGVVSANWKDCPAKEIFPGIRKRILWRGENGAEAHGEESACPVLTTIEKIEKIK